MAFGVPAAEFGPEYWAASGRPRQPYSFEPITVLRRLPAEWPTEATQSSGRRFLPSPIGHRLLRLPPGAPEPFITFVADLGLEEFLSWTSEQGLAAWDRILDSYQDGKRRFHDLVLHQAWANEGTVHAFTEAQTLLQQAHALAAAHPTNREATLHPQAALHAVVNLGWENTAFAIDIEVDEPTGLIYEYPRHVFARAWFELVESIAAGRYPRACAHCGTLFIPGKRSNEQYCPGTTCRNLAFRARYDHTPYRREYQRRHKQVLRGTATTEEFEAWKRENKPPKRQARRDDQ